MTADYIAYQDRTMFEALTLLNRRTTHPSMRRFCQKVLADRKTTERRRQMIENLRGTHSLDDHRIDSTLDYLEKERDDDAIRR